MLEDGDRDRLRGRDSGGGPQSAAEATAHGASYLWQRIQHELPECNIAERTVRQYVQQRKAELGLKAREAFVPQSYAWGAEAQVDFYESHADLGGERVKLQVFAMRSMASGAAFHCAYRHATQQAFLEAHERAFAYFGGVFRKLRYDNLGAAVRKILRGHRREETARFIAFRSHWRFEAEFCTPAEAHENAYVESFNGKLRDECLNVSWFRNLWQARARIEAWRKEYNSERPHSALGYRTPEAFRNAGAPSLRNLQMPQILAPVKATLRAPAAALTVAAVCLPDPISEAKEQTKQLNHRADVV